MGISLNTLESEVTQNSDRFGSSGAVDRSSSLVRECVRSGSVLLRPLLQHFASGSEGPRCGRIFDAFHEVMEALALGRDVSSAAWKIIVEELSKDVKAVPHHLGVVFDFFDVAATGGRRRCVEDAIRLQSVLNALPSMRQFFEYTGWAWAADSKALREACGVEGQAHAPKRRKPERTPRIVEHSVWGVDGTIGQTWVPSETTKMGSTRVLPESVKHRAN